MCNSDAAANLRPLWREWRRAFFADLVAGTVPGVEAGRMAMMSAFDEETNLVGTPAQMAADRGSVAAQAATFDRTHFKIKIEAEEFPENEGWWVVDSAGASGGRLLQTNWGWWGGECRRAVPGSVERRLQRLGPLQRAVRLPCPVQDVR